jgi:hypothetical protein
MIFKIGEHVEALQVEIVVKDINGGVGEDVLG